MSVVALSVPDSLKRWVAGIWRHASGGACVRVLPDGCHDLLFDLGSGEVRVIGAMRRASIARVPVTANWLGVRLHPGASALFLGASAAELVDRVLPWDALVKPELRTLGERLADARAPRLRFAHLASALADARSRQRAVDQRLARAVELSRAAHGALGLRALASAARIGERQLERLFLERIGIGPKLFGRIVRLEHALTPLTASNERHAELAARAGYSDEAHFAREVRDLCGVWPRELARERRVGFVQAAGASAR